MTQVPAHSSSAIYALLAIISLIFANYYWLLGDRRLKVTLSSLYRYDFKPLSIYIFKPYKLLALNIS